MMSFNHALESKVKTITEVARILDVNNTPPMARDLGGLTRQMDCKNPFKN
jgi:hypothetical protein